jgi:ATP-dependent helicase HepA
VELLRRFNLLFAIFDEERCVAIEENNPEANPFLDDQLVLCPISWPAHDEKRFNQITAAGWDLVIVDEAHHLTWAPDAPSPEYTLVETLGQASPGLLLLTATPQQLGPEGHFARLRLLDPDRYPSLEQFLVETEEYAPVAKIADKLVERKKLTAKEFAKLASMPGRIGQHAEALQNGDTSAREPLLAELLDQHGTGRVMFRNTRAALSGFPKRIAKLVPLDGDVEASLAEYKGESFDVKNDTRITWLVGFIKKLKAAKALVICRTREKAEAVEDALRNKTSAPTAVFHEGLTLLQRDRNAAYFADEEGAQILICSEIGSEGRNFQFAHHLVLFDLPDNPELLEQRIGRLDRIGQTADIQIHVPYVVGGPFEILARWYQEGLNAFEQSLAGGAELYARFGDQIRELAGSLASGKGRKKKSNPVDELVAESAKAQEEVREKLAAGQDRLLELNSSRPRAAAEMIAAIQEADSDTTLDDFMLRVFDAFSVHVEDLAPRTWIVIPGSGMGESFPGIPPEGITLTADRKRALSLEDVAYLTWDHPAVRGAFELLIGTPKGNSSIGVSEGEEDLILLEAVYILETVAPAALQTDRFLPATPVRVILDHRTDEYTEELPPVQNGPVSRVLGKTDITFKLIPRLLEQSYEIAEIRGYQVIANALAEMQTELGAEIDRLKDLQAVNPNVKESEIEAAQQHFYDMRDHLADARLRLDSVRLIFMSPQ